MGTPVLEFEHVSGIGRGFRLRDVSFALPAGYILGLAGRNGAGKTTLLDYIINPRLRYRGVIRLDGADIRADHTACRGRLGLISEWNPFFEEASVLWNARELGAFYEEFDGALFESLAAELGISTDVRVGALSRGERMRFQMAFAMAHHARLYLVDEATAGMDPVFRTDFFRMLREASGEGEASVLMATHLADELGQRVDYTAILEEGRLAEFCENAG